MRSTPSDYENEAKAECAKNNISLGRWGIVRSLHCKACNISLNDRDSMFGHLKGTTHLMQLKRLKDHDVRLKTGGRGLQDVLVPDKTTFDEDYWKRERGPQKLRPEQERFLGILSKKWNMYFWLCPIFVFHSQDLNLLEQNPQIYIFFTFFDVLLRH